MLRTRGYFRLAAIRGFERMRDEVGDLLAAVNTKNGVRFTYHPNRPGALGLLRHGDRKLEQHPQQISFGMETEDPCSTGFAKDRF